MNGVTGRMGANQHLGRSILAIIEQGGVKISNDETIMPRPLLVGRNAGKVETLAREHPANPLLAACDPARFTPEQSAGPLEGPASRRLAHR